MTKYKKLRCQLRFEVVLCRLLGAGYARTLPCCSVVRADYSRARQ